MRCMVKIYGAHLGIDSEVAFFEWAWDQKLECPAPVSDCEQYSNGKKKPPSYATPNLRRVYEHFTFRKYTDLALELIEPQRQPIIRRDPICRSRTRF